MDGSSKFFAMGASSRANGVLVEEEEMIKITYHNSSTLADELTDYASLAADDVDKDTFPNLSSPPAVCSSLQSPVKSSQHGSHFSSPGRDTEEEEENVFETPKASGSTDGSRKRRSLVPHSPSDNLASKKRRTTVTPPRGEPILAVASSPGLPEPVSPLRRPSRIDLRKACKVDESSSVHQDWETRAEADDEPLDLTDDEEEPDNQVKAQAVARGLRAKYTFTPKVSSKKNERPHEPQGGELNRRVCRARPLLPQDRWRLGTTRRLCLEGHSCPATLPIRKPIREALIGSHRPILLLPRHSVMRLQLSPKHLALHSPGSSSTKHRFRRRLAQRNRWLTAASRTLTKSSRMTRMTRSQPLPETSLANPTRLGKGS